MGKKIKLIAETAWHHDGDFLDVLYRGQVVTWHLYNIDVVS